MDANIMDMTVKWLLHIVYFLVLTYFFRERLTVEGVPGYLEVILIIVPLNLIASGYVGSNFSGTENQPVLLLLAASFSLTFAFWLIFSRLLPGLVASNLIAIGIFSALFSLSALVIRYEIVAPVSSWG